MTINTCLFISETCFLDFPAAQIFKINNTRPLTMRPFDSWSRKQVEGSWQWIVFKVTQQEKWISETINCNIVGDSKEGTSPSFRSLCFPKVQIFVEMFAQIYGNREGSTKWRMEKSDLCHRRYRLQNSRYLAVYSSLPRMFWRRDC